MQKAGGIVALIGGISGLWVAVILVLLSALSGTWSDSARAEIMLAVWSALTSFFAALAIRAKTRKPGALLLVCALCGPLLILVINLLYGPVIGRVTSIFFAVFFIFVAVGGVLALVGAGRPPAEPGKPSG